MRRPSLTLASLVFLASACDDETATSSSTSTSATTAASSSSAGGSGGGGATTTTSTTTTISTTSTSTGSGGAGPCVPVDDDNACTVDLCDENGATHALEPDGTACTGEHGCVVGGVCSGGVCVGGDAIVCGAGTVCVGGTCAGPVCGGIIGLGGPPEMPVGDDPVSIAAADLDGDGLVDLVVANKLADTVSVLRNLGPRFAPAVDLPAGGGPVAVVAVDLDGDGKPDLVVADADDGAVSMLRNLGGGAFGSPVAHVADPDLAALAAADIDGDGRPDLVIASGNLQSGVVRVLFNDGAGAFTAGPAHAVVDHPTGLAIGDLDGDGLPDVAVAATHVLAGGNVTAFFNQGGGVLGPATGLTSFCSESWLALADLDGDGRLDLVAGAVDGDSIGSKVQVLKNQGGGTFGAPAPYWTFEPDYTGAVGDIDGDGHPDIVVGLEGGGVGVLRNQGDGTFAGPFVFGTSRSPHAIALADLDADGTLDVAVANPAEDRAAVLYNRGGGWLAELLATGGAAPVVADLNGDGRPDLVVFKVVASTSLVSVQLQQADGSYLAAAEQTLPPDSLPAASADLDGDGRPDLVIADRHTGHVSWMRNQGDGTFAPPVVYTVGSSPTVPVVLDVNGDGHLDLAVVNRGGSTVRVLVNQGDGTLVAQAPIVLSGTLEAIAAGDLDGDGAPDLAIADQANGRVLVLLDDGQGTFAPPVVLAIPANSVQGSMPDRVVIADLDGDGRPDLVVARAGDSGVSTLRNFGHGVFGPPVDVDEPLNGYGGLVAAVDLNGDGKPELVRRVDDGVRVLVNAGDGTFGAALSFGTGLGSSGLAVADLDGDAKPDFVIGDVNQGLVRVLRGACVP